MTYAQAEIQSPSALRDEDEMSEVAAETDAEREVCFTAVVICLFKLSKARLNAEREYFVSENAAYPVFVERETQG